MQEHFPCSRCNARLGLFNLVFVLAPFILLVVMLLMIFIIGVMVAFSGIAGIIYSLLQLVGFSGFPSGSPRQRARLFPSA